MMRKVIFFLLLILTTVHAWADNKATLTADAPDVVVSGDQFRLTFTVNTEGERFSCSFHNQGI